MPQQKDAKALSMGRGGGPDLLSVEKYYELAIKACGITDDDLALAGRAIKDALQATKLNAQGLVYEDHATRVKAALVILGVRGVPVAGPGGPGSHTQGSGRVNVNVILADYAAPGSQLAPRVTIDVDGQQVEALNPAA